MPNGVPMAWMATLYEHPPMVVDRGNGAAFTDVDGNTYLDFNLADMSMFAGHGGEAVARATFDAELYNVQRLYMANRGVWEAIDSAGPACGIQTTKADVDRYLETLDGFLDEVVPTL
jgi:hypothetical protein